MALDADPGVDAVASTPMWLNWVSETGQARRHAPTSPSAALAAPGVLVDVRPDDRDRLGDDHVRLREGLPVRDVPGRLSAPGH